MHGVHCYNLLEYLTMFPYDQQAVPLSTSFTTRQSFYNTEEKSLQNTSED